MAPSSVFVDGALEGRVAVVTGGGTNLGRGATEELVRCGASVVIAGRRADLLEEAAATHEHRSPTSATRPARSRS